jgi:hypothetical protein
VPQSTTINYERPTSPTPTAGLGNFSSLSSGLGLGPTEAAASGSGRRMRHVWGSLRERLGWRTAGSGNGNSNVGTGNEPQSNSRTRPDGTPMDAREIMLAEMARAFNLGLGLGGTGLAPHTAAAAAGEGDGEDQEAGDSPSAASPAPVSAQRLPEVPLTAEGSFERFLVDLQADLRVALSSQDPPTNQLPYTQRSDRDEIRPLPTTPSSTEPTTATDQVADEATGLPVIDPLLPTFSISSTDQDQDDQVEGDENLSPPLYVSPPPQDEVETDQEPPEVGTQHHLPGSLTSATRSDSESNIPDGNSPETSETPRVPRTSATGAVVESGPTSSAERRPGGGINWWRSYRFPAITTPHAHGLSTTLNSTNSAASPLPSTHTGPPSESPAAPPSSAPAPSSPSPQDPEAGPSSPAAGNRPNIVIPVIVVGLQSVSMDRGRDQVAPFGDNDGTFGTNHNEPESPGLGGEMNFDGMLGDGDPGPQPHGRTWHSRAADAFRNLRPGRRASRAPQTSEGPGSRTFLIYVIGGEHQPMKDTL